MAVVFNSVRPSCKNKYNMLKHLTVFEHVTRTSLVCLTCKRSLNFVDVLTRSERQLSILA